MTRTDAKRAIALEAELARLLGKTDPQRIVRACRGDYRGTYDYSLRFADGSSIYIGNGGALYLEKLKRKVEEYRYYRNNYNELKERVAKIISRDNTQSATLGLKTVEFVDLELITEPTDQYAFWIQLVYRIDGHTLRYKETSLFFACQGFRTEEYFSEKIFRPDDCLGCKERVESNEAVTILLGYAHGRKELNF